MPRQLDNRASITLSLGLETARKTIGLSTVDLARKASSTPQHIYRVEDRLTNPAQVLIANLAQELGKTPADLYLLGELRLEERKLSVARRRRHLIEEQHDLQTILDVLHELDGDDLQTVVAAALKLS